ncbi:MAG: hypothetical protein Q9191_007767 [Dirinaria sp. TL-2023a]
MDESPAEAFVHDVEEQQLANLIFNTRDWQITHGMLLKYGPDADTVSSVPIGVSLFPTPFPRQLFENAQKLQVYYNRLYASVSEDEEWLYGALRGPRSTSQDNLPANDTIRPLANALCTAQKMYGSARTEQCATPGILFVVQPWNINICDERPLEYALWNHNPSIPTYRVIFGEEVLAHTSLSATRELMYQSPSMSSPLEIAVVYMRAGYDLEEYTPSGYAARLLIEKSRAIKCPSILCHLATFKKVQQELAVPGVLERFLRPRTAAAVATTFMPMYPMDDSSSAGKDGRRLACDATTAAKYVLKPSLEGGGHNIYGLDIPSYLNSIPETQWQNFILMERINSPSQKSVLLPPRGMNSGANDTSMPYTFQPDPTSTTKNLIDRFGQPTVSELGIFGTCIWTRSGNREAIMLENSVAGWSFKTKPANVNEMSVVKGYGCFDSPYLIDMDTLE